MNKSQLVHYVADRLETSQDGAKDLIEVVLGGIVKGLREDHSVMLSGFGTFQVKPRKARPGRNPQTGETIRIEAGRRVGFRVGKNLRNAI